MMRLGLAVVLLALPACAEAPDWRRETGMIGVEYAGRVPQGGFLSVEEWRSDGGFFISEDLHSVSNYSSAKRLAVSVEAFRHREPDGVAAWTIADFWSWPASHETAGVVTLCALSPDWEDWSADPANYIVAIAEWDAIPPDEVVYSDGILAAVRVDLVAGQITPIETGGVYCFMEGLL